jgi:Sigma-70, region 4
MLVRRAASPGHNLITDSNSQESLKKALEAIILGFEERDAHIFELRFGLNGHNVHTFKDIGKDLHLTEERVRQIQRKSLLKLNYSSGLKRLIELTGLPNANELLFHVADLISAQNRSLSYLKRVTDLMIQQSDEL